MYGVVQWDLLGKVGNTVYTFSHCTRKKTHCSVQSGLLGCFNEIRKLTVPRINFQIRLGINKELFVYYEIYIHDLPLIM